MMRRLAPILLTLGMLGPSLAHGQADAPPPTTVTPAEAEASPFTADSSVRAGYWTRSHTLDGTNNVLTGSLWTTGRVDLGSYGEIRGDGWMRGYAPHGDQQDRSPILRGDEIGRLREFRWRGQLDGIDLSIGRQMFPWGRADGINPTDNLTPTDYLLLTPDDTDQRFGNFAVQASHGFGDYTLQGIWQPEFQSDLIPLRRSAGIAYSYAKPSSSLDQVAMKLDRSGGGLDWSLSYYDGNDTRPDLLPLRFGRSGATIGITNRRKRVLGGDFSAAIGDYVLRGEAAYVFRDNDGGGIDAFFHKRSQASVVLGGERRFGDNLTVGLQYFAQQVIRFRDPNQLPDPALNSLATFQNILSNQLRPFQHGMTFRMSYSWANDTWTAETSDVVGFTTRDYLLRGKLSYAVNDHVRINAGFVYLNGPPRSLFGYLNSTSTSYAELRYVF